MTNRTAKLDLKTLKIVLVDDDMAMRSLMKQILHAFDIKTIDEYSDGAEALRELQEYQPDLVICDWMMEPMDGLSLTREIRTLTDNPNKYVPIIMLTGHTEQHRVEQARDVGVSEFLAKPVSVNSVFQRLETAILRKRPFIESRKYNGPDRRRRNNARRDGEEERRTNAPVSGKPSAPQQEADSVDLDVQS